MQKQFWIIASLLLLLDIQGFSQKNKVSEVYMERTPCFGRCPWYNVLITKDGYIHYEGKRDTDLMGIYEGTVPKKDVQDLLKWFQKQNIPKEETSYTVTISDLPRQHMSFKNKGIHVAVKNAQEGPAYWKSLGEEMDNLIQKAQWKKIENPKSETPSELEPEMPKSETPQRSTEMPAEPKQANFSVVEQMPEFPGGQTAMMKYLTSELQYPKEARSNNVSGKVIVKFVVDKEGNIKDAQVVRGIGSGCDEEALRVIQKMPRWIPGYQNGKPVNVFFHLPVSFVLK